MATKPPPQPAASPATAGVPSISRRQPLRQARSARKPAPKPVINGIESSGQHHPPANFYPALAAFTDAVDALPSEIIRHFTLLREVDAKACLPEANLRLLIDAAERLDTPGDPYEFDEAMEALKQLNELRQRRDNDQGGLAADPPSVALLAELEKLEAAETAATAAGTTILGTAETRRARCHQIRGQIADLLITQDEKIHVITTAVDALNKHLGRVEHAFAYVEKEIPSLYRKGNPEHWAYKEPMKRGTAAQIAREKEREKREQEERYHQIQMERESHVRGAVPGRAGKSHHHYAHHQHQDEPTEPKKKARKTGDNETLSSTKRIADQQAGAQQQQATKKRKAAATKEDKEKATNAKGTASPRAGTPVPKKVKTVAQRAPRRTAQTPTASATNSPLLGQPVIPHPHIQPIAVATITSPLHITSHFPAPPIPAAALTSTPALPSTTPIAPSKSHAKKETPKPVAAEPEDVEMPPAPRYLEVIASKEKEKERESPKLEKEHTAHPHPIPPPPPPPPPPPTKPSHKKKQRILSPDATPTSVVSPAIAAAVEEPQIKKGSPIVPPPKKEKEEPVANTKSKPAASSGELKTAASTTVTPGSTRNRKRADSSATAVAAAAASTPAPAKKSHKAKSQQKPVAAAAAAAASTPIGLGITTATTVSTTASTAATSTSASTTKTKEKETAGAETGDDEEEGEETYCYCNQISYGEMVACDGDECEREWFHLSCVGLSQAPRGKAKWYCNDCAKGKTSRGASRV
ncbi:hypothetical protein BZA05DRAFT_382754 [Tricharina praecox]|uniref:uncharacterized protein n=1 Tax=Tricharina praecox TaxID=43433 RepID=UPI002220F78E|nr:uncharacterized protein BZA05DRAFT_382754 [Tricharina praecox]KAI5858910.1 hypothetical protein BZA05DRAFT_382754 [Tricharina praecox]